MSTVKTEYNVKSSDKVHTLAGHVYIPVREIKGLLHVVHGMCEHIERYGDFMRRMAENGYVCFGYDNLGHGRTAQNESELGFIAHKNGYKLLAEDVKIFSSAVRRDFGEKLPYYLMGHSMGSFIVRYSAVHYVSPDKLIIMGTGGMNPASGVGIALVSAMELFKGEKYVSNLVDQMAFGSFCDRFGEDDSNAWLTTDAEIREKYRNDKYCSFKFTLGAMKDLMKLNRETNSTAWFKEIRSVSGDMPILLVSGADDPVGDYGSGVMEVYNKLTAAGCNAKIKLYENCRHEILNDSCRDETVRDILDFVEGEF